MSEPTDVTSGEDRFQWAKDAWAAGPYVIKAAAALVFIVNSVALGLYGFGLVRPSESVASAMGAVSLSFAAVVLWLFIYNGVRYQPNKKKR